MLLTKDIFNEKIMSASSVCILGHINPDGDCVGSALAVYNYIKKMRSAQMPILKVHLSDVFDKFVFLPGFEGIDKSTTKGPYDLAIVCDCADMDRLGRYRVYLRTAKEVLMIDHHETNAGFGDFYLIISDASSTSEVIYSLMDEKYFDKTAATCIYTGIVHDTGVFRYASTHPDTLRIAARCMELGVDFGNVIEDFFFMTLMQKKMLGNCLINMHSVFDGKVVYAYADATLRDKFGGSALDMDGMIDNIRTTRGALAAFFIYASRDGRMRASLRSNTDDIDVSIVASEFGGGGHKRAAGCFVSQDVEKDINKILTLFKAQLDKIAF